MDFLYRTKPPAYKGSGQAQPTARAGFLDGIWCWLFGRTAPAYRTADGTSAPTASRCGSPQYKAPPEGPAGNPYPEPPPTSGEPMGEDCPSEPYVEPREIHIYPTD